MSGKPDRLKFNVLMLPMTAFMDPDADVQATTVYADEAQINANGDLCFVTYVPEAFTPAGTEPRYTPRFSLMIPAGRWTHFEDVSLGNTPLWMQSGKIDMN